LTWIEATAPPLGLRLRQIPSSLLSRSTTSRVVDPVSGSVALIIIAVAVLVLVSGISLVLAGISVALILAVSLGYCEIGVTQGTEVDSDGTTRNDINFDIIKC